MMDPDGKKFELTSAGGRPIPPDATVTAIIKVDQADYVPSGVEVRARVDRMMFTGAFRARLLRQIESDPHVVSVALSKRLRVIE